MNEGYFTIAASEQAHKKQKAGRGSKIKSNVLIMTESTILEDIDTGKVDSQCRYFKAKVLEDHKAGGTDQSFKDAIDGEQTIISQIRALHM